VFEILFENISEKLQDIFSNLKRKGKLEEKDIELVTREVKLALLEADVNFKVVKDFIKNISQRALGSEILKSLTPSQQFIKIVNEELINILGNAPAKLSFNNNGLTCYVLVGLQGSGKTTMAVKLAVFLKKQNKKVLLVACDIYRPAAITQLKILAEKNLIQVFAQEHEKNAVKIAQEGVEYALKNNFDIVIIDTAGRLNVDEELMQELINIKRVVKPQEILLVVDAMIGQEIVRIVQGFNDKLGVDGVIATKLDSDTRGGAVLSIRAVTQVAIKFIGTGEKINDLEKFFPDRMSSRILGKGDILSVIEKAQANFEQKEIEELEKKMLKNEFTLQDFYLQLKNMKKLGPVKNLIKLIPGLSSSKISDSQLEESEKNLVMTEAIILSMTVQERNNVMILNASRKKRIAKGSGTSVKDINELLKRFDEMKKMMKMFTGNKKSFFGSGK